MTVSRSHFTTLLCPCSPSSATAARQVTRGLTGTTMHFIYMGQSDTDHDVNQRVINQNILTYRMKSSHT